MAYKRMKPARPPGSSASSTQFSTEIRQAVELKKSGRLQKALDFLLDFLEKLHRRYPTRTEPLRLLLDG